MYKFFYYIPTYEQFVQGTVVLCRPVAIFTNASFSCYGQFVCLHFAYLSVCFVVLVIVSLVISIGAVDCLEGLVSEKISILSICPVGC